MGNGLMFPARFVWSLDWFSTGCTYTWPFTAQYGCRSHAFEMCWKFNSALLHLSARFCWLRVQLYRGSAHKATGRTQMRKVGTRGISFTHCTSTMTIRPMSFMLRQRVDPTAQGVLIENKAGDHLRIHSQTLPRTQHFQCCGL